MSDVWGGTMIICAVGGILLYFLTNRIDAPGRWFFQDTWLDDYIPLVSYFVIPYVALYPYIIGTMLIVLGTPFAFQAYTALAIAAWTAALFWYLFPAGILRKRDIKPDFFTNMIIWLYEHDHENNTIPSSHVFYAIICSYYLALIFPAFTLLFVIGGFLISISTVLTKEHHLADILGGIVWAVASIALAHWIVGV
jgi:membrane-associated phospholipid phosphatase